MVRKMFTGIHSEIGIQRIASKILKIFGPNWTIPNYISREVAKGSKEV
jgi:hypothetical protein